MEPYCHEDYPMQPIPLHHLASMILMIDINDDDVTMTVEIVMVIEEIKEVVEVVVVVDKSIGIKTKVRPYQVDALLELGVFKESRATEGSQVHLVPNPTPEGQPQKWRFTGGLEGWSIPNIQQIINRNRDS